MLGVGFGDRVTSFLPSAHIADRMCGLYIQEMFGTQVTVVSEPGDRAALPDVRPTVWGAVHGYGKSSRPESNSWSARNRREEATGVGVGDVGAGKRAAALLAGEEMPDDVAAEWAKADELVLSKVREKLGFGELRWAISGAAPIPRETLAFFAAIGIPIGELWGMSELSCAAT